MFSHMSEVVLRGVYSIPENIPIVKIAMGSENNSAYVFPGFSKDRMTANGYKKNVIWIKIGTKVCSGSRNAFSNIIFPDQWRKMKIRDCNAEKQQKAARIWRE